jgi:hypothetical protein
MITIFFDFRQLLAENGVFSQKNNVMIKVLYNLALFLVINAHFSPIISAKIYLKSRHRSQGPML